MKVRVLVGPLRVLFPNRYCSHRTIVCPQDPVWCTSYGNLTLLHQQILPPLHARETYRCNLAAVIRLGHFLAHLSPHDWSIRASTGSGVEICIPVE